MSPFFQYEAVSKGGTVERGSVMASDPADARTKLRRTGMSSVVSLEPVDALQKRSVSPSRLQEALTSLSILIKGGLPILAAIQAVSARSRNSTLRSALLSMSSAVESGQSLTDAAAATGIFPEHLLAGMKVGEESGKLAESLTRAAEALARENAFRRRMEGILLYPCVVFSFSMIVIGFLITFVVPKLTEIFEGSTQTLPILTRILIAFSNFIQSYGPLVGILFAACVLGAWTYFKTDRGGRTRERMLFRLPVMRKIALSRWMMSLSVLLESGLDLIRALEVSKASTGSRMLSEEIDRIKDGLRRGRSFSALVAERPMFDVIPSELLAAGESGGQLRSVCGAASAALEEESTRGLERFAVILEPALILSLGIFSGVIVVSVLLPIADLSKTIQ